MNGLAVIVVNYRTPDLTIACLAALEGARAAFPDLRVIAVDGGSEDGSAERIADAVAANGWGAWVTPLPLAINGGFAFANNQAIARLVQDGALPEAIALINPDARVRPGALEALAALLDREPTAGAVGALLTGEDGAPQSSAFRFPTVTSEFCRGARTRLFERLLKVEIARIELDERGQVPWVTGAAVLLRTAALAQVGVMDDGFFLYFEETELMRRLAAAGWTTWHEPRAIVIHEGGAATNVRAVRADRPRAAPLPAYWFESRRRYFGLHGGRVYAFAAGLAWLLGMIWWQARQLIAPRADASPPASIRRLIRFGLWPTREDARPARNLLTDEARGEALWMRVAEKRP